MDSRLDGMNFEEIRKQRIVLADRLMSILDEDGQPMYNEDWIERNIITESDEIRNPE